MNKNFYKKLYDEQETTVCIDYSESELTIYTSRKSIFIKLESKLGTPFRIDYINGLITGGVWKIPFSEKKKLTSVLSRPLLIGSIK